MYRQPVQTPFDRKPAPKSEESQAAKSRSRAALVAELNQVADEGSRAFWRFWRGMTQAEKAMLLHGPEEEQVTIPAIQTNRKGL